MLRDATASDRNAVATVLIESRRKFLPFAPSAHPDSDVYRWVGEELIPTHRVFVWEEQTRLVGVLAISRNGSESWISQLYIAPGWTGQQIGTNLLLHAHALLEPPVLLWTFQANAGARRFYERHGYKAVRFTDGQDNEERCPDVLYTWKPPR